MKVYATAEKMAERWSISVLDKNIFQKRGGNIMGKNIIEEYAYVHDNEILSYYVDICNKTLQISTKYCDKEKTLITFTGFIAHRFENVTYSNIILGITQVHIDYFINENMDMLNDGLRYAFPIFARNCEELRAYLKENEQKVFEISSSSGLSGFVIAKEISIEVTTI